MKRKYKFLIGIFVVFCSLSVILVMAVIRTVSKKDNGKVVNSVPDNESCNRKKPYVLAPEFDRALSLIEQRESEYYDNKSNAVGWIRNCLYIEYADTGEAEGMFYFDDAISSPERLVIKVNPSYKETDDLLTALLLRHELEHAGSYIIFKKWGTTIPCLQGEASAFHWQYQFYRSLTKEEQKSIISRLVYGKATGSQISIQIQILDNLSVYHVQATKACAAKPEEERWGCYTASFTSLIKKYIENNPFYQKQCGL